MKISLPKNFLIKLNRKKFKNSFLKYDKWNTKYFMYLRCMNFRSPFNVREDRKTGVRVCLQCLFQMKPNENEGFYGDRF